MVPVTQQAHELVSRFVSLGDVVIDATSGNGHDTLFLARLVGPNGRVLAIDLQETACDNCRVRLNSEGVENVHIVCGNHADLAQHLSPDLHGQVSAVMFNLGYLPGGNKQIVTNPESTITALNAALMILRLGGVISIAVYRGHPGGQAEENAVNEWIRSAVAIGHTNHSPSPPMNPIAPCLLALAKSKE